MYTRHSQSSGIHKLHYHRLLREGCIVHRIQLHIKPQRNGFKKFVSTLSCTSEKVNVYICVCVSMYIYIMTYYGNLDRLSNQVCITGGTVSASKTSFTFTDPVHQAFAMSITIAGTGSWMERAQN